MVALDKCVDQRAADQLAGLGGEDSLQGPIAIYHK